MICATPAGVVQWQDLSFPSSRRGFDSHRPLQSAQTDAVPGTGRVSKFQNPLPGVPHVESPFFDRIAESEQWDPRTYEIGRALREQGWAVIDFPEPDLDAMAARIRRNLFDRYDWDRWRQEGWARNDGLRLQDAWQFDDDVRRLAGNAAVRDLLGRLYGRPAFPCQTLNFTVVTQQAIHSDSTHFSSVPERYMCGVWLAFEDTDEDNGALEYYPGSHRLPVYLNEHIDVVGATSDGTYQHYPRLVTLWQQLMDAHGLRKQVFRARKGQALIWTANLLHGGGRQRDPERTRWSQVTHYYFEGCSYYTPLLSDPVYGSIHFREPVCIATGRKHRNQYAGFQVDPGFIHQTLPRQRGLPLDFEPADYYAANPDVAAAGVDAAQHYLLHGRQEKRRLKP